MNKKALEKYFKGKKVTVMGLGLLGGLSGDIEFLHKCGAKLTVTDLKSKEVLTPSLKKLSKYKGIRYVLGRHELADFHGADMILHSGNVPESSVYIVEARKNKIPVFTGESLFAKVAEGVVLVGVTGTRGKSMATHASYEVLSRGVKDKKVYLGGNIRGVSTLALLSKVKEGDIVVLELDSWALHGFRDTKMSPHVSVFTSFMKDHMNFYTIGRKSEEEAMLEYYKDKAAVYNFQTRNDILIIRPNMKKYISKKDVRSQLIVANKKSLSGIKTHVVGDHNLENIACAYEVGKAFGIKDSVIKKALSEFRGVEGRLEYLATIKGVKIYNDNNATTPEATSAGILSFSKKVILIAGGNDKGVPLDALTKAISKNTKAVYLTPGTGTNILQAKKLKVSVTETSGLKEALPLALKAAKKGDIILFSPAFSSFAQYNNEYERNDEFVWLVSSLKN